MHQHPDLVKAPPNRGEVPSKLLKPRVLSENEEKSLKKKVIPLHHVSARPQPTWKSTTWVTQKSRGSDDTRTRGPSLAGLRT